MEDDADFLSAFPYFDFGTDLAPLSANKTLPHRFANGGLAKSAASTTTTTASTPPTVPAAVLPKPLAAQGEPLEAKEGTSPPGGADANKTKYPLLASGSASLSVTQVPNESQSSDGLSSNSLESGSHNTASTSQQRVSAKRKEMEENLKLVEQVRHMLTRAQPKKEDNPLEQKEPQCQQQQQQQQQQQEVIKTVNMNGARSPGSFALDSSGFEDFDNFFFFSPSSHPNDPPSTSSKMPTTTSFGALSYNSLPNELYKYDDDSPSAHASFSETAGETRADNRSCDGNTLNSQTAASTVTKGSNYSELSSTVHIKRPAKALVSDVSDAVPTSNGIEGTTETPEQRAALGTPTTASPTNDAHIKESSTPAPQAEPVASASPGMSQSLFSSPPNTQADTTTIAASTSEKKNSSTIASVSNTTSPTNANNHGDETTTTIVVRPSHSPTRVAGNAGRAFRPTETFVPPHQERALKPQPPNSAGAIAALPAFPRPPGKASGETASPRKLSMTMAPRVATASPVPEAVCASPTVSRTYPSSSNSRSVSSNAAANDEQHTPEHNSSATMEDSGSYRSNDLQPTHAPRASSQLNFYSNSTRQPGYGGDEMNNTTDALLPSENTISSDPVVHVHHRIVRTRNAAWTAVATSPTHDSNNSTTNSNFASAAAATTTTTSTTTTAATATATTANPSPPLARRPERPRPSVSPVPTLSPCPPSPQRMLRPLSRPRRGGSRRPGSRQPCVSPLPRSGSHNGSSRIAPAEGSAVGGMQQRSTSDSFFLQNLYDGQSPHPPLRRGDSAGAGTDAGKAADFWDWTDTSNALLASTEMKPTVQQEHSQPSPTVDSGRGHLQHRVPRDEVLIAIDDAHSQSDGSVSVFHNASSSSSRAASSDSRSSHSESDRGVDDDDDGGDDEDDNDTRSGDSSAYGDNVSACGDLANSLDGSDGEGKSESDGEGANNEYDDDGDDKSDSSEESKEEDSGDLDQGGHNGHRNKHRTASGDVDDDHGGFGQFGDIEFSDEDETPTKHSKAAAHQQQMGSTGDGTDGTSPGAAKTAFRMGYKGFNKLRDANGAGDFDGSGVKRRLVPLDYFRELYLIETYLGEDEVSQSYRVRERKSASGGTKRKFVARFFFADKGKNYFSKNEAKNRAARANPLLSQAMRQQIALSLLVDHPRVVRSYDFFYHCIDDAEDIKGKMQSVLTAGRGCGEDGTEGPSTHLNPRLFGKGELGMLRKRVSLLTANVALKGRGGTRDGNDAEGGGSGGQPRVGFSSVEVAAATSKGAGGKLPAIVKDKHRRKPAPKRPAATKTKPAETAAVPSASEVVEAPAVEMTPQQKLDELLVKLTSQVYPDNSRGNSSSEGSTENESVTTTATNTSRPDMDMLLDNTYIYGVLVSELVWGPMPPALQADDHNARHGGGLSEATVAACTVQLCEALQYMHNLYKTLPAATAAAAASTAPTQYQPSLIHNNLRGENVLLDSKGNIKIVNFDNTAWLTAKPYFSWKASTSETASDKTSVDENDLSRTFNTVSSDGDRSSLHSRTSNGKLSVLSALAAAIPFPICPIDLTAPDVYTAPEIVRYVSLLRGESEKQSTRRQNELSKYVEAAELLRDCQKVVTSSYSSFNYTSHKIEQDLTLNFSTAIDCYQLGLTLYRLLLGSLPTLDGQPSLPILANQRRTEGAGVFVSLQDLYDGSPQYAMLSTEARHLLEGLILRSMEQRFTIPQILNHPFVMRFHRY